MNHNYYQQNLYRNSYGSSSAESYHSPNGIPRRPSFGRSPCDPPAPRFGFRPYTPSPRHASPRLEMNSFNPMGSASMRPPYEGGFMSSSASSPCYRPSPSELHYPGPPSSNSHSGMGRGGFRRNSGGPGCFPPGSNGRQSFSGTPPFYSGGSMGRGMKRPHPNFNKYDCNPGGSSDIKLYYNTSMLTDPWAGLKPVSVRQVVEKNTPPCYR